MLGSNCRHGPLYDKTLLPSFDLVMIILTLLNHLYVKKQNFDL